MVKCSKNILIALGKLLIGRTAPINTELNFSYNNPIIPPFPSNRIAGRDISAANFQLF